MPLVMLKKEWGGDVFRRCVREGGEVVDTLLFPRGKPVDVPWDRLPAISKDLFVALWPVSIGPTGKPVFIERADYERIMAENELEEATAPAEVATNEETSNGAKPARRSR